MLARDESVRHIGTSHLLRRPLTARTDASGDPFVEVSGLSSDRVAFFAIRLPFSGPCSEPALASGMFHLR
jgi:hypothetical protein